MPAELSTEYLEFLAHTHVVPFAFNAFVAILVFYIGRIVARILVRVADKVMVRAKLDESLRKFLSDMLYAILIMMVSIAALERLGVQTTAAVAILGAAGLAVGFALQGSLGNFASGVMIVTFKPYKVGDVVSIAGQTGAVEAVRIFNTILHTPDNRQVIIPNGQVTGGVIENITALGQRRVDLVFGIGYDDDIKKSKELMMKVLTDHPKVLAEPAPQVAVSELADSSVNFVVRPWCKIEDYWDVRFDVTEAIKLSCDANGISIPFPQRDGHLRQVKDVA